MFEDLLQDLRFGVRMLRKNPGSTLVAGASLALGIGATTAIFTIINAVLLRPLPYKDASALVVIWEENSKKNIREFDVAPPNFRDWAERSRSFASLSALRSSPATLLGAGQPERIEIARVSPNLFSTLGVPAIRGRVFVADDGDPSKSPVAILSAGLWKRRFGADPSIIGGTVTLDSASYTVVGVAELASPLFQMSTAIWVPYILDRQELAERGFHTLKVVGRLAPGVSVEQAGAEMKSIAAQLTREFPDMNANWSASVVPLSDQLTGKIRRPLWTLLGAVGLVLLIACVNVAGILLMKAGARHRELAIRAALGASARRVLAQMLTESLVLAIVSGVAGIALAWWGTRLLLRITPAGMADAASISVDWRVLLFALMVALCAGVLFGLAPAISALRPDLNSILRAAGRSGMSTAGWTRMRGALVIAELALAQVLLVGAGLLIHSFINLQGVEPGFHPERVVSMRLALPETRYKQLGIGRFFERLVDRASVLAGVEHAAVTRDLPLSGANPSLNFEIEGRPALASSEQPRARFRTASAGYFEALGLQLVRGRFFERTDSDRTQPVAIVNETLARREWPGQDPIGRRVRSGFDGSPWCTIVGVVADVRHAGLDSAPDAEIYYHYLQVAPALMAFVESTMTLVVRTSEDPASIVAAVRGEVAQLDSELAVYDVRTADEIIAGSVAQPKFRTLLLSLFAGAALLLAAIGLYGLLASTVFERTSELGIRRALGAGVGDLTGMILGQGLVLSGAGIGAGLALGFVFARLLERMLFGITVFDWVSFVAAPLSLLAIAALASLVPAIRASRVDPAIALREQ